MCKINRLDFCQFLISVHNQSIAQWEFYCFCFILIKDLDSWFIYQNQNNSSILCLYSHCRNIVNFISIWHFLEQNIFFFAKEVIILNWIWHLAIDNSIWLSFFISNPKPSIKSVVFCNSICRQTCKLLAIGAVSWN